jgi:hypothetical protein
MMDPVTLAIVTALVAGASAGATKVAEQAIVDGYNALKTLISERFGGDSELVKAVDSLEAKPESEGRRATLEEEVVDSNAAQEADILATAEKLLALLKSQPDIQTTISVRDGAAAVGDQAKAVGKGGMLIEGDVGGDVIGPDRD